MSDKRFFAVVLLVSVSLASVAATVTGDAPSQPAALAGLPLAQRGLFALPELAEVRRGG